MFTDPPYGMRYTSKAFGGILGDALAGDGLVALVGGALHRAVEVARPGAAVYVCLTWRTFAEFERALASCALEIASTIVWDKGSIGLGSQHYRPRHEFIFYCQGARWFGGRDEGDVWTFTRGSTAAYVHPTQKPVALIERALRNSSMRGDVVLDMFGGSGSTLLACHRLQRRARLVELDPRYVDVIVRRWQRETGSDATLEDGRSFRDVAAARDKEVPGDDT